MVYASGTTLRHRLRVLDKMSSGRWAKSNDLCWVSWADLHAYLPMSRSAVKSLQMGCLNLEPVWQQAPERSHSFLVCWPWSATWRNCLDLPGSVPRARNAPWPAEQVHRALLQWQPPSPEAAAATAENQAQRDVYRICTTHKLFTHSLLCTVRTWGTYPTVLFLELWRGD